ncbi:hypothetical protein GXM_07333 [Nostoc sphaeroides CCNUC1]|uniref:TetR family transcriptional regulator n=1 Tax=Nostoc sphaeroides CCNUC1 TaxID=2653204 RepID=A0A5P8WD46_9NOSO|nr:hypothetical protein GXM_07333 [Nostoc sphaeroides CCNUC1]
MFSAMMALGRLLVEENLLREGTINEEVIEVLKMTWIRLESSY